MNRLPRWSLPLYGKILLWLGLNLVLLAVVLLVVMGGVGGSTSWDAVASGPLGDRPQAVAGAVASELSQAEVASWTGILERFATEEGVKFSLHRPDGTWIAGERVTLPSVVQVRMPQNLRGGRRDDEPGRPPGFPGGGGLGGFGPPPGGEGPPRFGGPNGGPGGGPGGGPDGPRRRPQMNEGPPPVRIFADHTAVPDLYWLGVRIPLPAPNQRNTAPGYLVIHTPSLVSFAGYIGLARWVPVVVGMGVMSGLLWWPLIGSITRSIKRLNAATEAIAQGRLETRVVVDRGDELGRLGVAVNQMAERLERFVGDERRFMGDIAHELGSPLGRAQLALSLLERKVDESDLTDIREEVEQMTSLVSELLAFSKATLSPRAASLDVVDLAELVAGAVARERAEAVVNVAVGPGLTVLADASLLGRAVANLVRNAVKYATPGPGAIPAVPSLITGESRPISVTALQDSAGEISLLVEDSGPGVPSEFLSRLGDPFFRPEAARSRETGGAGLGLAIVKSCVHACGGRVEFANREPSGLRVKLTLKAASVAD